MSSGQTTTVPDAVRRRLARQVADAALAAVDPAAAIQHQVKLDGHRLMRAQPVFGGSKTLRHELVAI